MKTIIPGSQLYSCRTCNYDLCFDCVVESVSLNRNLKKLLGEYLVDPAASKGYESFVSSANQTHDASEYVLPGQMTFESSMESMMSETDSLSSRFMFDEADDDLATPIPPSPLTPRLPPSDVRLSKISSSSSAPSKRFISVSSLDDKPLALLFVLKSEPKSLEMVEKLKSIYPFKNTKNGMLD